MIRELSTYCMSNMHGRRTVSCVPFVLVLFWLYCFAANAQVCPFSHVVLILHDADGRVLNAQPFSTREHSAFSFPTVGVEELNVSQAFRGKSGRVNALVYGSRSCAFAELEETTFDVGPLRMKLIFRNAKRDDPYYSTQYTIDAPAFETGAYEIDLSSKQGLNAESGIQDTRSNHRLVFNAQAWRKIDSERPAFRKAHKITFTGRVVNEVTRLAMADVPVELRIQNKIIETVVTRSDGAFEIGNETDEELTAVPELLSIRAAPPGYVSAEIFIDDFRRLVLSRDVFDEIPLNLIPVVRVNGRLVEEATNASPSISGDLFKAFSCCDYRFTTSVYRSQQYSTSEGEVGSDGRFELSLAVGKNTITIADYQKYHSVKPGAFLELSENPLVVDVEPSNPVELIFRVRKITNP